MPLKPTERLRLVVISEGSAAGDPQGARRLLALLEAALRGGATAIMLREGELPPDRLVGLAADVLCLTRAAGAWLIVNHAVDVALDIGADAVHLGWRSEPLDSVRERAGRRLRIGVSTHTPAEVADAARRGADYVTFGPVFPTPSKVGLVAVQGLEGVRAAREAVDAVGTVDTGDASGTAWNAEDCRPPRFAIVGLGGIDEARAASVIEAGADGIAVIRAVMATPNPEDAARRLRARVGEDWKASAS